MACGRRRLRPVRIPVPPHPHDEPQTRDPERAARRFTRPAAGAAARAVPPRGVSCDAPRAARPWRDGAPAWGVPRPARGGGASRAPLCLEGRSRRLRLRGRPRAKPERSCGVAESKPTTSSSPGWAGVGDRAAARDRADRDGRRLDARGAGAMERPERVDVARPGLRVQVDHMRLPSGLRRQRGAHGFGVERAASGVATQRFFP